MIYVGLSIAFLLGLVAGLYLEGRVTIDIDREEP